MKRVIAATAGVALLAVPAMVQSRDVVPISPAGIDAKPQGGNWLFGTCRAYVNDSNLLSLFILGTDREWGDGVTLVAGGRVVTNITLLIHSGGYPTDAQIRFFEGGDSGPEPGALIWESDVFTQVNMLPGTSPYNFPVPNVQVPDEFTWTLELTNVVSPQPLGSRFVGPPTVGFSEDWVWLRGGGAWSRFTFDVRNNSFGAIIETCDPADCEACDMNCDDVIDAFDIEPFLALLFEGADPCCGNRGDVGSTGDVNGDGAIDAFDIEPFLECLFP